MEETKRMTDVTFDRERGIGGSDISSIMEFPQAFTKRYDLLLYKTGLKDRDFIGNEYTQYGNILEPKIREYINKEYGYNFKPGYIEIPDDTLDLFYHADGVDHEEKLVLEIKTTSQIHEKADDYKYYLVQLLMGMYMWGYDNGVLAVYHRPDDFDTAFHSEKLQFFSIGMEDYELLMKEILDAVAKFRIDYLYLKETPYAEDSDLPSRSALTPVADKLMTLEADIAWAKDIVSQYDELKKDLCQKMQDFNVKSWTMPNGTKITLVPKGEDKTVKKFDEKEFKKDHEDLYAEYERDRIQKGKSAYVRITPMAKREKA